MPSNNNNNVAQQTTPWAVWCTRAKHTMWWCVWWGWSTRPVTHTPPPTPTPPTHPHTHHPHLHPLLLCRLCPPSPSHSLSHTPVTPFMPPNVLDHFFVHTNCAKHTQPACTHHNNTPHNHLVKHTQPTTNTTTTNGHMVPSTPTTTTTTPHRCRVL